MVNRMFQFIFFVWAIGLGLVTGILAAFAINAYRFMAEIKEGSATFYAYTTYAVLMSIFALLSGGFNAPAAYVCTSVVVALILSYLESPSGAPLVSRKAIEASPVQFLYLGRIFVVLGGKKDHGEGAEDSCE